MLHPPPAEPNPSTPAGSVFTWRAIALGLVGVTLICGFTPFNNIVLANTFLVGNLLPVGLLLFLSMVVLLLNTLLRRWASGRHLSTGELCVVFSMALVSCTLPSSGMMRYLPSHLVGLFNEAFANADAARGLDQSRLADFAFPDFQSASSAKRGAEPVVREYVGRSLDRSAPWRAWIRPALSWGLLILLLYGAMMMLLAIVRRQWQENERLAFPLAEVYLTLLESPDSGRLIPPVFRTRSFWIATAAVFIIHVLTGLAQWFPKVPSINVGYNFNSIFSEPPLSNATYGLKAAKLVFTVVGMSYFINLRVSFSIIFFFLLFNVAQIALASSGQTISEGMQRDQTLGAIAVMGLMMVYVGRAHWMLVIRNMIGARRDGDAQGDTFGSYAVMGWVGLTCAAGAMTWFTIAGAEVWMSAFIVLGILSFWLVMARLAAESGLIYAQLHNAPLGRSLTLLTTEFPLPRPSPRGFFAAALSSSLFVTDQRESMAVFTSTSTVAAGRATRGAGLRWMLVLMLLALAVGFIVSGASTLWCEYRFDVTSDLSATTPINPFGLIHHPRWYVLGPLNDFLSPAGGPQENHSRLTHMSFGAVATGLVSILYLRFASFPLHPIGALMAYSYPVQNSWLGIFAGWLAKALLTRFGGSSLYRTARPAFLGLIFGEMGAVALWLIVNLVLAAQGIEYRAVNVQLP